MGLSCGAGTLVDLRMGGCGVTRLRVIAAAVVALSLVGAGCNSRLIRPPTPVFIDGGEFKVATVIEEKGVRFPSVLLSYFPSRIPLHPGDTLNFEVRDTGEPHTVALGRLVDAALAAVDELGPTASLSRIEGLTEMRKLPYVFPRVATNERPRVNRSAAERCFLDDGTPPVSVAGGAPACDRREQPPFDGTQSFYSSGFIEEGESFRTRLSGDIRPGTYRFMCLVHRAAMTGAIEARSPDEDRPTVAELRRQGTDERNEIASTLEPPARVAARRTGGPVLAGTGPSGRARGFVAAFVPDDEVRVRVGEPVTWKLFQPHTISFNPTRDAREGILIEEGDGIVRLNSEAWAPAGSRPLPAAARSYPPKARKLAVDGGTWSGEGFFSSGVIRATPPAQITYTLRFAEPGTYRYVCLIHDSMRGRIEVTEA